MAKYTVALLVSAMAIVAGPQSLHAQSQRSTSSNGSAHQAVKSRIKTSSRAARRAAQRTARRQARRAKRHLQRGLKYYGQRQFERAIGEFSTGYDIDPQPAFLFALGQSERRSGDCASATVYYRRFLATAPPERQVQAATMHIEGCKRALENGPGNRLSKAPPKPRPVQPIYIPPVSENQPSPWYRDWLGNSLLATGTASVATGVVLILGAQSATERASWVETYAEYDMELSDARRKRLWGVSALAVGTALVAGAAYRYHRRQKSEDHLAIAPDIQPMQGGVAVGLGGRF